MSKQRRGNGRNHREQKVPLWRRLLRNRYNPRSAYVTLADVIENVKSTWYAWAKRVPPGARLIYRNGRVVGHTSTWRGRR